MLVRCVETFRRGEALVFPGETFDVSDDEAAALIETGVAVPAYNATSLAAKETRILHAGRTIS